MMDNSRRSTILSKSFTRRILAVAVPIGVIACISRPFNRKCSRQRSSRGLKKRTNPPVSQSTEPTSLPLFRLQKAHAKARLSGSDGPPCFKLMMWSTWHPAKVSSSWIKQYSHRWPARSATNRRNSGLIILLIPHALPGACFCQPHNMFKLHEVIQLRLFLSR